MARCRKKWAFSRVRSVGEDTGLRERAEGSLRKDVVFDPGYSLSDCTSMHLDVIQALFDPIQSRVHFSPETFDLIIEGGEFVIESGESIV
jgi:hypothetical protein